MNQFNALRFWAQFFSLIHIWSANFTWTLVVGVGFGKFMRYIQEALDSNSRAIKKIKEILDTHYTNNTNIVVQLIQQVIEKEEEIMKQGKEEEFISRSGSGGGRGVL